MNRLLVPVSSALGAALIAGCAPPGDDRPPPPPIVWEGEHIRFGTDEALGSICAGTLPYADSMAGYLAEVLGVDSPQLDVYWVPSEITAYCTDAGNPESSLGCASDGEMFSLYALHQHEMVHALRPDDLGYAPLEEGLAEVFGDDWTSTAEIVGDEQEMFEIHDGAGALENGSWVPLAGFFASFIRARDGADTLVELVHATELGGSFEDVRSAFVDVLGQPFEDAVRERDDTYLPCDHTYSRDNGLDCAQQAVPGPAAPEDSVVIDIPMDCAQDDVLGPRRGERWKTIVIEIPETGVYILGADKLGGLEPGSLRFRRCGQSCFEEFSAFTLILPEGATMLLNPVDAPPPIGEPMYSEVGCIAAGRYTVRASVVDDDDGSFQLRIARQEGDECDFLD